MPQYFGSTILKEMMPDTLFTKIAESISEAITDFQSISLIVQRKTPKEKEVARQASNKLYKIANELEEAAFDIDPPDELAGEILLIMESAIENSYNGKFDNTIQLLTSILDHEGVQARIQLGKNNKA